MTAARTADNIRADLDAVRNDLMNLSDGTAGWDQVYPELANGCLQDMAVEMAYERVRGLRRELDHASGERER